MGRFIKRARWRPSIWMIQAAICDPMRLRRHKHRPLLEEIAALIIDAADTHQVTIAKVAAHQGLGAMGAIGNNEADTAAKEAARQEEEACDIRCKAEAHGFSDQVWIRVRTENQFCQYAQRTRETSSASMWLALS